MNTDSRNSLVPVSRELRVLPSPSASLSLPSAFGRTLPSLSASLSLPSVFASFSFPQLWPWTEVFQINSWAFVERDYRCQKQTRSNHVASVLITNVFHYDVHQNMERRCSILRRPLCRPHNPPPRRHDQTKGGALPSGGWPPCPCPVDCGYGAVRGVATRHISWPQNSKSACCSKYQSGGY